MKEQPVNNPLRELYDLLEEFRRMFLKNAEAYQDIYRPETRRNGRTLVRYRGGSLEDQEDLLREFFGDGDGYEWFVWSAEGEGPEASECKDKFCSVGDPDLPPFLMDPWRYSYPKWHVKRHTARTLEGIIRRMEVAIGEAHHLLGTDLFAHIPEQLRNPGATSGGKRPAFRENNSIPWAYYDEILKWQSDLRMRLAEAEHIARQAQAVQARSADADRVTANGDAKTPVGERRPSRREAGVAKSLEADVFTDDHENETDNAPPPDASVSAPPEGETGDTSSALEGEWSEPMSKTEIARRHLRKREARPRQLKEFFETHGLREVGGKYVLCLDKLDKSARRRLETPLPPVKL